MAGPDSSCTSTNEARFWCRLGIHCDHHVREEDHVRGSRPHGPYLPLKFDGLYTVEGDWWKCCYCGREHWKQRGYPQTM